MGEATSGSGQAMLNAITDVPGVLVGHRQRLEPGWATGSTVILTPEGATAGVDVRGAGPGTRETDVLAPDHLVQRVQAIVLSGGSAYGLSVADGVMRWLAERGHGFPVGATPHEVVPIVPAAVLFDLPMGDWGRRPNATFGYGACETAHTDHPGLGNVGAGTGAVAGGIKGGVGTVSTTLPDGSTVGALMVVNSVGSVIDPSSGLPWAASCGYPGEFDLPAPDADTIDAAARRLGNRPGRDGSPTRPLNTTIGVVATDLTMSKAECRRVSVAAHDGIARAVRPAHGMTDGDTVFTLATGRVAFPSSDEIARVRALDSVCEAAAEVTSRAIVAAVLSATSVGDVPGYTDLYAANRE